MSHLLIMVGLLKAKWIKNDLFTCEEMEMLRKRGITGKFEREDVVLSFEHYIPSDPSAVADEVCHFLAQHIPLESMRDPTIGIWVEDNREVLDCLPLVMAFDSLVKSNQVKNGFTGDETSEKIFYSELEVGSFVVQLNISELISEPGAILSIETDPVKDSTIVEDVWLAVFKQVLVEVLKKWQLFSKESFGEKLFGLVGLSKSRESLLTKLFEKYEIDIPLA